MRVNTGCRVALVVLACSLLLGAGGRVVMVLLAALQGTDPEFTLGGTLEVVAMGVIIGVPAGLAMLVGRLCFRRSGPLFGATGGGLLFLGLALAPPPAAQSASAGLSSAMLMAAILLFAILFVGWGAILAAATDRMFGLGGCGGTARR
jgi:hypothetical protein